MGIVTKSFQSELAVESRLLARRSTWCAVVFALAVVVTALNVLPPVQVQYTVRSEVLVSPVRLTQLQSAAGQVQELPSANEGQPSYVTVELVQVLDRAVPKEEVSSQLSSEPGSNSNQPLVLIAIETTWQADYSEERLHELLHQVSLAPAPLVATTVDQPAVDPSLAKWELTLAQSYLERHEYLSETAKQAEQAQSSFSLASHHISDSTPDAVDATVHQQLELEEYLKSNVAKAEKSVHAAEASWSETQQRVSGVLAFAQTPELSPRSSTIPFWMSGSIIVLGLCAGAVAGWTQHRLNAGGVFDPATVANQLSRVGLPIAGRLQLGTADLAHDDWMQFASRKASKARRLVAMRLTTISEWALWFWVCIIAYRLVVDSLWRDVFIGSPLAALGRLILGLP